MTPSGPLVMNQVAVPATRMHTYTHTRLKWMLKAYLLDKLLTLMLETGQSFLANLNAK